MYDPSNTRSFSCVPEKIRWLSKLSLGLLLIIIEFWSDVDFKSHIIFEMCYSYINFTQKHIGCGTHVYETHVHGSHTLYVLV
jgi:hypothetical protein